MLSRLLHDYAQQLFGDDSAHTTHDDWIGPAASPYKDHACIQKAKRCAAGSFMDTTKPVSVSKHQHTHAIATSLGLFKNKPEPIKKDEREKMLMKCCGFEWGSSMSENVADWKEGEKQTGGGCADADFNFEYNESDTNPWVAVSNAKSKVGICGMYKKLRENRLIVARSLKLADHMIEKEKGSFDPSDDIKKLVPRPYLDIFLTVGDHTKTKTLNQRHRESGWWDDLGNTETARAKGAFKGVFNSWLNLGLIHQIAFNVKSKNPKFKHVNLKDWTDLREQDMARWQTLEEKYKLLQQDLVEIFSRQHLRINENPEEFYVREGHPCNSFYRYKTMCMADSGDNEMKCENNLCKDVKKTIARTGPSYVNQEPTGNDSLTEGQKKKLEAVRKEELDVQFQEDNWENPSKLRKEFELTPVRSYVELFEQGSEAVKEHAEAVGDAHEHETSSPKVKEVESEDSDAVHAVVETPSTVSRQEHSRADIAEDDSGNRNVSNASDPITAEPRRDELHEELHEDSRKDIAKGDSGNRNGSNVSDPITTAEPRRHEEIADNANGSLREVQSDKGTSDEQLTEGNQAQELDAANARIKELEAEVQSLKSDKSNTV